MSDLCIRCLLDEINGAFCPRCGRSLVVPKHIPSANELRVFVEQVTAMLPRLRQMHTALDDLRSDAIGRRSFAAVQLIEKRQMFLLRVEHRLGEHLRSAQRVLSDARRDS